MGCANPFLMASTPAMKVVLTAPRPTSSTPSFPSAGLISTCFATGILMFSCEKFLKMILASRRSELTNLAHYWRRIAGRKKAHQAQKRIINSFCACVPFLRLNKTLAEFAGSGAGGEAEGFGEMAAAEIADARANLRYGEIGFRE